MAKMPMAFMDHRYSTNFMAPPLDMPVQHLVQQRLSLSHFRPSAFPPLDSPAVSPGRGSIFARTIRPTSLSEPFLGSGLGLASDLTTGVEREVTSDSAPSGLEER